MKKSRWYRFHLTLSISSCVVLACKTNINIKLFIWFIPTLIVGKYWSRKGEDYLQDCSKGFKLDSLSYAKMPKNSQIPHTFDQKSKCQLYFPANFRIAPGKMARYDYSQEISIKFLTLRKTVLVVTPLKMDTLRWKRRILTLETAILTPLTPNHWILERFLHIIVVVLSLGKHWNEKHVQKNGCILQGGP